MKETLYTRRVVLGMAAAATAAAIVPNAVSAKTVKITSKSLKEDTLKLDLTGRDLYEVAVSKKDICLLYTSPSPRD